MLIWMELMALPNRVSTTWAWFWLGISFCTWWNWYNNRRGFWGSIIRQRSRNKSWKGIIQVTFCLRWNKVSFRIRQIPELEMVLMSFPNLSLSHINIVSDWAIITYDYSRNPLITSRTQIFYHHSLPSCKLYLLCTYIMLSLLGSLFLYQFAFYGKRRRSNLVRREQPKRRELGGCPVVAWGIEW